MIVLMQNDYPIGIYSSSGKADAAALEHYQRLYAHERLKTMRDYNYRQYVFLVDEEAK